MFHAPTKNREKRREVSNKWNGKRDVSNFIRTEYDQNYMGESITLNDGAKIIRVLISGYQILICSAEIL